MKRTKHKWEPTDNQGYALECLSCGKNISFVHNENWSKTLHESCEKESK